MLKGLYFPGKYHMSLIHIWIEGHMDRCPFRFTFKSGFNLAAKFLAYSNEK